VVAAPRARPLDIFAPIGVQRNTKPIKPLSEQDLWFQRRRLALKMFELPNLQAGRAFPCLLLVRCRQQGRG
jgi:hypothetical protein